MAIADIRREYSTGELRRADLDADPLAQFNSWFAQASSGGRWRKIGIALFKLWHAILGHTPADVNAMVLATVDKNGRPSTRTVLLKAVDARGFVFYTNHDSRKGLELADNPNAALTFYWPELERQVCVAGTVEKISREESEELFQIAPARQPARGVGLEPVRRGGRPRRARRKVEPRWRRNFPATCRCRRTGAATC